MKPIGQADRSYRSPADGRDVPCLQSTPKHPNILGETPYSSLQAAAIVGVPRKNSKHQGDSVSV